MNLIEMVICQLRCVVGNHFLRFAFEAHALTASAAENFVTTIDFDYRHAAVCVGALPYSIFSHIADEICISLSDLNGLVAGISWMCDFLAAIAVN